MKHTFNIGEFAVGGIVNCELEDDRFTVQCVDEITKDILLSGIFTIPQDKQKLFVWLGCDVTSSYYADKILDYFKINM
jgi:hypothetical protein